MRTIQFRRHTMRRKPNEHLSQQGVELAQLIGQTMGPFDQVITSPRPRAAQTAIAMGYGITSTIEILSQMPPNVYQELGWPNPFSRVATVVKQKGPSADFANILSKNLTEIAQSLPPNGTALVISHGGLIELAAIGCLPMQDHDVWGGAIAYCEGVQLTFDTAFIDCEILRAAKELAVKIETPNELVY